MICVYFEKKWLVLDDEMKLKVKLKMVYEKKWFDEKILQLLTH
jgi:hypothetical protein